MKNLRVAARVAYLIGRTEQALRRPLTRGECVDLVLDRDPSFEDSNFAKDAVVASWSGIEDGRNLSVPLSRSNPGEGSSLTLGTGAKANELRGRLPE